MCPNNNQFASLIYLSPNPWYAFLSTVTSWKYWLYFRLSASTYTRCLFHQHFACKFFVQNCFLKLFSSCVLAFYFFGKKYWRKRLALNVDEIDTKCPLVPCATFLNYTLSSSFRGRQNRETLVPSYRARTNNEVSPITMY